ncbi:hemolysin III family protein [uncultured Roseovarius sp.]|uniref:PAQR family membrane homeostasis protein TrhA n=1 Tax=uncultured Roseovarius sp. TaxID=293344 RepID=UPI0034459484
MSYPAYSRAERLADGAVHVAGILAALTGIGVLFAMLALRMDGVTLASTIVYSGALLLMLAASAAYHLYAHTVARPVLRRLDHAAIYVKIAGTFTPLSVLLGTAFGYAILGLVWCLALFGAATKIMAKRGHMTTGWLPYVALGWIGVTLFIPLAAILPSTSLALLVCGGLLYTFGVVFYAWDSLRFANAIWHFFVAIASACFFLGITSALATRI